ncbi:MAG: SsrA-binding protein SmpB [Clostridia bacterium]|nr:SsrA-binding protein SmpB [Clostridia bacterium]
MGDIVKIVAQNKKAYHEYFVDEKFEAGLELTGTEVKSVRKGAVNLKDAFCRVEDGEMLVFGMHISPYENGNIFNREPMRTRRLLMHKKEIMRLFGQVGQKGYALIPLSVYFRGKWAKMEIGLCRGKKLYDKRDAAAEKSAKREMDRAFKEQNR